MTAPIWVMGQRVFTVVRRIVYRWDAHSVPRLAAALSFYAVLSLAPFLVLIFGASAMLFGERITRQDAIQDLRGIIGPEATLLVASMITDARSGRSSSLSGVGAIALLLFGASSAFVELRSALNCIWDVNENSSSLLGAFFKDRFVAFAMTCVLAVILIASFLSGVALTMCQAFFARLLVLPAAAVALVNLLVSFAVTTLVFSLLFRYVAVLRIRWKDALTAGVTTAAAFVAARVPLDLYLSHAAAGSAYGAAASMVVFLLWMYVAAQIFYLGGEFVRVLQEMRQTAAMQAAE